ERRSGAGEAAIAASLINGAGRLPVNGARRLPPAAWGFRRRANSSAIDRRPASISGRTGLPARQRLSGVKPVSGAKLNAAVGRRALSCRLWLRLRRIIEDGPEPFLRLFGAPPLAPRVVFHLIAFDLADAEIVAF